MLSNKETQKLKKQHLHLTWWHWEHKHCISSKMHFWCKLCTIEETKKHIWRMPYMICSRPYALRAQGQEVTGDCYYLQQGYYSHWVFLFGSLKGFPTTWFHLLIAQFPAGMMLFLPGPPLLDKPDLWANWRLRTPRNENPEQNMLMSWTRSHTPYTCHRLEFRNSYTQKLLPGLSTYFRSYQEFLKFSKHKLLRKNNRGLTVRWRLFCQSWLGRCYKRFDFQTSGRKGKIWKEKQNSFT